MKISREVLLGTTLLVVLIVLMTVLAVQQNANSLPPLASISSAPDGTLALKIWLGDLGYKVDEDMPVNFQPPQEAALIFVLQPDSVGDHELTVIDKWVSGGGTLIAAGDNAGMDTLAAHYGFSLQAAANPIDKALSQAPLLISPAVEQPIPVNAVLVFSTQKRDFVTLVSAQGMPVVVMFTSGLGRVILSSTAYPFTNQGLKSAGNPQLVLNLIAAVKRTGPAWFDEWHHGLYSGAQILGTESWLRYTPGGNAVLFTIAVIFLALLLQGGQFGRPLPTAHELKRRGSLEYLTAVANLNRRAGHRTSLLQQYRQQVKRHLGHRYRLDPAMPDEEFVALLVLYNPALDAVRLRDLLMRLGRGATREADLVKLAAEASQWLEQ